MDSLNESNIELVFLIKKDSWKIFYNKMNPNIFHGLQWELQVRLNVTKN